VTTSYRCFFWKKQIGNKDNPFSIEDLKEVLNLQFERLSTDQSDNLGKESALFTSQFKGKCRNCGKLGHIAAQCKSKQVKDEKSDVKCNYCKKSVQVKANCFKLLRKNLGMNNSGGTQNGQNGVGGSVVLSSMTKIEDFGNDIWIGDSGASCHYCNNDAALYDYSIISEDITVGNINVMTAKKKWGSYDVRFCRRMV
jgi:Zinc knuckle